MDNKSDVKAMMARFQSGGTGTGEASSAPAGRTKVSLHPTLSSGVTIPTKKPVLESLSGSAINHSPKSPFLKNSLSTKVDTVVHEANKNKALASRFTYKQEDADNSSKPLIGNKQQKPPLNKPALGSTMSDSKPAFPKPVPAAGPKPSWIKEDKLTKDGGPSAASSKPKILPLQQKPTSSILKLRQQSEENAGGNAESTNLPSSPPNSTLKPISNFKNAQNMFNKEKDKSEPPDSGGTNKPPLSPNAFTLPPKPPANKKPSLKKPSKDSPRTGDATLGPKCNPLPNSLALGSAPAKPNRPPRVNLENLKRGAAVLDEGSGPLKTSYPPTHPKSFHPSNHSNHVSPPPPPQAALPSLPPRHPASMIQQEDFYDDVDELKSTPPPLPSPTGHPSQKAKDDVEDDGEMYDDLDERWEEAEQRQEKKKEKEMKDAKKRQENDKKEQKERDKKEQDAKKKFKLVGPLEVIHQGKACMDCKGSKTDLGLKQGDSLDIIRVQGNPEGKWLGRTQDGSIGYVKTTSVEIDFNTLKNRQSQQPYEPEVYDDIDIVASNNSGIKGPGVVLPPPPGEEGEIYDDVVDPNLDVSPLDTRSSSRKSRSFLQMFERSSRPFSIKVLAPPSQFSAQGNSDQTGDDEIYDDVDSQNVPPPLPISIFPILKSKKTEEMDPKKQKKFEKEEKDFRKKFKYDGEIQVLYQVTIVTTLTNKKWSGKELPVKAGERLDVVVKAMDNKMICRNEEGKFGYVSTCYIVSEDSDIYDDIGDECIYDND